MPDMFSPIPAGEILKEEFLEPMGITAYRLAKDVNLSATCVGEILSGKRGISPETALKLGRYLKTGPEFWMNLQNRYELDTAKDKIGTEVEKIVPSELVTMS
jgi:antitoxin HigA-1